MVYREFDESQYLNKIEELETQVKELEIENKKLKHLEQFQIASSGADEALGRLTKLFKQNPDFFMTQKEKRAYRTAAVKKTKMTTVANQLGLSHSDIDRWKIMAGITAKNK